MVKTEKEKMLKAIERALKEYGIDWILNERYPNESNKPFDDLIYEIILAIKIYKIEV